jgi:hypothetical protein
MGALIKSVCDLRFDPVFVRAVVGNDFCVGDLRRLVMLWVCS